METRYGWLRWAGAAAVARTADEMAAPAVLFTVVSAQGSSSAAALATAALAAAAGIAGPFVGAALDAARSSVHLTALAMLWMATWLSVLTVAAAWSLGVVVVVAFLAGLAGPALTGGWTAQLGAVVSQEELPRATAVDAATYNVAGIAGPALAGALAGAFGARFGVLGAAVALATAIPLALSVRLTPAAQTMRTRFGHMPGPRAHMYRVTADIRTATNVLVKNRSLLYTTLVTTTGYAGLGAALVAAQLLGTEFTGVAAAGGFLIAAFAAGGLGGTLAMTAWPARWRPDVIVTAGTVVMGAAFLAVTAVPTYAAAAAVFAAAGAADGALLSATLSIRHREAPAAVRAQLFTTAASLKLAAYAAGLAVSGALFADGDSAALAAGAAQLAAVSLGVLLRLSRGPSVGVA